jgi:hypothetical protein
MLGPPVPCVHADLLVITDNGNHMTFGLKEERQRDPIPVSGAPR